MDRDEEEIEIRRKVNATCAIIKELAKGRTVSDPKWPYPLAMGIHGEVGFLWGSEDNEHIAEGLPFETLVKMLGDKVMVK